MARPPYPEWVWFVFGIAALFLATPLVRLGLGWGWPGLFYMWLGVIAAAAACAWFWTRDDA